jgi:hypothetical protein
VWKARKAVRQALVVEVILREKAQVEVIVKEEHMQALVVPIAPQEKVKDLLMLKVRENPMKAPVA